MSSTFLRYLTTSVIVLSSACDASVFDATPVKQQDAGMGAVSDDAGALDASTGPQRHDAGQEGGRGGAGDTQTGMVDLPAAGAGGAGGVGGAGGRAGAGEKAGAGAAGSAGAAGKPSSGGAGASGNPAPAQCHMSCSADHAQGMCKDGKCVFKCESRYADCNNDVDKAAEGDGCESTLADDLEHCGACNNRCRAPDGALSQCSDAQCQTVSLVDEPGQMLAPHGTPIDSVTTQLCHAGSVLTGIEGFVVDNMIADSIRIICSPLTLSGNPDVPSVSVGKASVPVAEYAGGNNREGTAKDPVPVAYKLSCGSGEVVRQLRVTVWGHWGDANGQRYDTIKDFAVACAKPEIKDGELAFGPLGELKTTSATLVDAASPMRDETDECDDNEAFLGFSLGFGSNIDRIVSTCSSWSLTSGAP